MECEVLGGSVLVISEQRRMLWVSSEFIKLVKRGIHAVLRVRCYFRQLSQLAYRDYSQQGGPELSC